MRSVRRVSDLAYRDRMDAALADDPLFADQALLQLHYVPTVRREPFHRQARIGHLIADRSLFAPPLPRAQTPIPASM